MRSGGIASSPEPTAGLAHSLDTAKVDPGIAFKKLRSMVEGAEIASKRLWK